MMWREVAKRKPADSQVVLVAWKDHPSHKEWTIRASRYRGDVFLGFDSPYEVRYTPKLWAAIEPPTAGDKHE